MSNNRKSEKQVIGEVIPLNKDEAGNIINIAIQTNSMVYIIKGSQIGRELYSFIHEHVEAKGFVWQRLDGKSGIKVSEYNIINKT